MLTQPSIFFHFELALDRIENFKNPRSGPPGPPQGKTKGPKKYSGPGPAEPLQNLPAWKPSSVHTLSSWTGGSPLSMRLGKYSGLVGKVGRLKRKAWHDRSRRMRIKDVQDMKVRMSLTLRKYTMHPLVDRGSPGIFYHCLRQLLALHTWMKPYIR